MSNAERIAMTRKQEFGYDEFNENAYTMPVFIEVRVHGKVKVYKPRKEAA